MKTLNISGIVAGDSLQISVSQNALTAGPYTVGSWGGSGGDGGTITINVDRTQLQVAPDSVRFTVDLSAATFDTQPGTGDYDPQLHDLIYLWDFDDSDNWTAPENVLPAWKNRNVAKGPFVAHMYTQPGTYTPSVLVVEPSSGKTATATLTGGNAIDVADPDTVYAGTDTICVSASGDFVGAPAGAVNLTLSDLQTDYTAWTNQYDANPKRWLFRAGEDFDVYLLMVPESTRPGIYIGSYGAGARPDLNIKTDKASSNFGIHLHSGWSPSLKPDCRVWNVRFVGDFDPTTETADGGFAFRADRGLFVSSIVDLMISDCEFTNIKGGCVFFNPNVPDIDASHVHHDNVIYTNFGGQYPFISGVNNNIASSITFTGCRFAQNPDAVTDKAVRAPIRINSTPLTHIRGCDFFHTDDTQPCVKLNYDVRGTGYVINMHSCSFEQGLQPLSIAATSTQTSTIQNTILDGLVIVGGYRTQFLMEFGTTGLTLRNSLFIQPSVPYKDNNYKGPISVNSNGTFDATVAAGPVRIYNNTFVVARSQTDNNNETPTFFFDLAGSGFTNVTEENNVIHMPNTTVPQTTYAPLADTVLWTPRLKGYKDRMTQVLDTSYATPADAVKSYAPLPGSAALGAALTGDVSYMDITLQDRPEPPSMGAWEAD